MAPSAWDRAAAWFMSVQSGGGSWNYHRDEASLPETLSMTAAGVGSLMICQRQLERYRHVKTRHDLTRHRARVRMVPSTDYKPSTSVTQIGQAINRGIAWVGANFAAGNMQDRRSDTLLHALRHRANRGPGRSADDRPRRLVCQGT